jgi:hypothetical protein
MQYTTAPTPLLPVSRIAMMSGFREKILSKSELARIEAMLERHNQIYENAPPSPQAAQRKFFDGTIGPMPQGGSHRAGDFVKWCRAIVEAAQLDPDHEYTLAAEVKANLETELPLLLTLFEERLPTALKEVVASADKSATDMKMLLGLTEKELFMRLAATVDHIGRKVAECKRTGDGWHDMLLELGIEML